MAMNRLINNTLFIQFQVAIRLESPAGRIVNLVHNVLSVMENSRDKIAMLYGIVDSFKDYAMDLHQYNMDLGMLFNVSFCLYFSLIFLLLWFFRTLFSPISLNSKYFQPWSRLFGLFKCHLQ